MENPALYNINVKPSAIYISLVPSLPNSRGTRHGARQQKVLSINPHHTPNRIYHY